MLKIFVLALLVQNLLVSGNAVTLVPLQVCPNSCNSCNQNNAQPRQNHDPNYQNYGQSIPNPSNIPIIPTTTNVVQQPSNNQVYAQGYTAPNQFTIPFQNQAFDPIDQLNQIYINKLLSNPTIQNLLDTTNLYSQLGFGVPNQVNVIPNNQLGFEVPNQLHVIPNVQTISDTAPHIVNNYFILPPEYFENVIEKCHSNPEKREKERRRKSHRNEEHRSHYDSSETKSSEHRKRQPKYQNPESNTRRDQSRRSHPNSDKKVHDHSVEEQERRSRKRQQHEKRTDSERSRDRTNQPREHRIREKRPQHNEKSRSIDRTTEKERSQQPINQKPEQMMRVRENPNHVNMERQENVDRGNGKIHKKSKDDEVIEEFRKKFPAIPEEVIRKLLAYLRNQLQTQNSQNQQFQYPQMNFPISYDQILKQFYQNQQTYNRQNNNNRPSVKTTTKPQKQGGMTKNSSSVPTTTEVPKTNKTVQSSVKQASTPTTAKEPNKPETIATKPAINLEKQETTTVSAIPEKTTKNSVPDVSIYDDYYPTFKDTAYESGESYNVRNLRDDRYYYTTDKNYEPTPSVHEYYINKLKNIHKDLENSFEDVIAKPDVNNLNEDEIKPEYKTSPTLDTEGFKTKQIVRHKSKPDHLNEIEKNISYKSSTYSDAKTPPTKDLKSYKINSVSKKVKPDSVETVYAHSKVIKYGKNEEDGEEYDTPVVTYYLPDNMQYEEDGKTVIVAKSIPADHFW